MMKGKKVHITISVLAGFIALTAIGGGIAILTGVDEFPQVWLQGTPFSDYTLPALLLAVVVGGSSLLAAVTIFTGRKEGLLASMAAGLIMAGYIVGEVLMLKQVPPGPTLIEGLYFGLGLVIFGLAAYLCMAEYRYHHDAW